MGEILSCVNLVIALAGVIATCHFANRCTQIERLSVINSPKAKKSIASLIRARDRTRIAATWLAIVAIYSGFILAAYFWAESVDSLRNLTLGSGVISIVAIFYLESRANKHKKNDIRKKR